MRDTLIAYEYNLEFTPEGNYSYGNLELHFDKKAYVVVRNDDEVYVNNVNYFILFEDGKSDLSKKEKNGFFVEGNYFDLVINEDDGIIYITTMSFDGFFMDKFKEISIKYLLQNLWKLYIEGKKIK